MVNLSAAGLGVSTSNVNQGLAEGLNGLTQGLVQGMKLKYLRQQQEREQADWEQKQQQTKAEQRAIGMITANSGWQPDSTGQVNEAMPQVAAVDKAVGEGLSGAPFPISQMGDLISRGAMSSSKPLGQAFDWENLKKHQSEFLGFLSKELEGADPVHARALLEQAKAGFKEDAMLLHRSHAVSQAHDDIVGGAFDTFTPDGQIQRDPEVAKRVSEAATKVEQGVISPEQYEAMIGPLREQAHASWVENKQRFYRAQAAQKDLEAISSTGKMPPDAAVAAQHRFATGRYDPKQFEKDWPELLKGNVLYHGEWERPETIEKLKQRDEALAAANVELAKARAASERADAEAKGPMGQMRAAAFAQARAREAQATQLREAMIQANSKAASDAAREGMKVQLPYPPETMEAQIQQMLGTKGGASAASAPAPAGGNKGNPSDVNADGASVQGFADSLKGRKRADVVSTLGQLRAAGKITDEQGKAIIAAMGGLPSPDAIDLSDPNSKAPSAPSLMGGPSPKLKAETAAIEADRKRLNEAEKLPPDQAREIERELMAKYGLNNKGELYAFKQGTMRPGSGVLK